MPQRLDINRELLASAMLDYSLFTGKNNILMTDFANWCADNDPEAGLELEKFAANIFNGVK